MCMLNSFCDCGDESGRLADWHGEGLLIQPFAEGLTGTKGRGDEADRTDFTGFINRDKIGMVKFGGRKRLTDESPSGLGAQEHLGARDFERNVSLELRIVRQEDDAAAALSKLLAKLETPDAMSPTRRGGSVRLDSRAPGRSCSARIREELSDRAFVGSGGAQWLNGSFARERRPRRQFRPRHTDGRSLPVSSIDALVVGGEQPCEVLINLERFGRVHQPYEMSGAASSSPVTLSLPHLTTFSE